MFIFICSMMGLAAAMAVALVIQATGLLLARILIAGLMVGLVAGMLLEQ